MIRLKQLRAEKNLSQKDLADHINVSRSTVAMWESGSSQPNNELLKLLSNYFSVSVDYLLDNTDQKEKFTQKNVAIPSSDDIKFALFNGDKEITDEMYEEVKRFAQFVKERNKNGNKNDL